MGDTLLRSGDRHDLIGLQLDAVAAVVPALDGGGQTVGIAQGVLVVLGLGRRFGHRAHDVLGRLKIGRADRQIDDVDAARRQFALARIQNIENIGLDRFAEAHESHVFALPFKKVNLLLL